MMDTIASKPKYLFLIDSLGAILSVTLYVTILANFESVFGIPQNAVYILAVLAGIYALYSGICYLIPLKNWRVCLQIIAIANLFHCVLTVSMLFYYQESLTIFGLLYFIGEFIIVISLAIVELKIASTKGTK
jgi:uncharacterized membrane protein HdeD (DUF308 family)